MTDAEPTYLEKLKAVCEYYGLDYDEYKDATDDLTKRLTISMYDHMVKKASDASN